MRFVVEDAPRDRAQMRVIGVGGAGGNAVNRMIDEELEGVDFISANTDAQALRHSKAPRVIQLGKRLTQGLGAGARPGIGRQAIAEDAEEVRDALQGADLVFIAAGMGGGTGTGAAPVIGEMAREMGALAIAVVTRPFAFEGKKRLQQAKQGLSELGRTVDTMVVVPNDHLLAVVGKGTSFGDALKKADEILLQATQGISDLIRVSGEVNVDFADVRTIMSSCGAALMGTGMGRGENRAVSAARDAIASPLLDNVSIRGASGVLINITGGSDLTIDEVTGISTMIQEEVGDDAEIIFGTVKDPAMEGEIRVTLIATGFEHGERRPRDGNGRGGRVSDRIDPAPQPVHPGVGGMPSVFGGGRTGPIQARGAEGPRGGRVSPSGGSGANSPAFGGAGAAPAVGTPGALGVQGVPLPGAFGSPRGTPAAQPLPGAMFGGKPSELELPTFIRRIDA